MADPTEQAGKNTTQEAHKRHPSDGWEGSEEKQEKGEEARRLEEEDASREPSKSALGSGLKSTDLP